MEYGKYPDVLCIEFVVNDYDLAALSDLQLQEILDTVSAGNVMLLGGGSRIGSAERLGIAKLTKADLPEAYGKYTEALPDIIPIPNTDENREELHLSDLVANYDSYKIGNGYIISFNADFSNSGAISSDTVFSSVIYAAYDYAAGSDDYGRESLDTQLIGYTDRLPNLTDNTIKVIFGIIYLYIAFIPILYVVLKRKDKREASIKVIPAAAVGISILIYLVSFNTVYKKPIASVINYADLRNADSGIAELKTYMNIVSPGKGDIKIELEGSSEILEVSEDNYSAYNYYDNTVANTGDGKIISAKILSLDNGAEIELAGKTKWDSTYITLSDNYEMNGGLDGEISIDNISSKLTGKITNDSGCDFDEAVVVIASDQGICEVKKATDIKKGDSIDVSDFDIDALSLEPQNYYSFADVINPYASTYSRNKNLSESYRLEMEQDIVDGVCGEYDFYDSSNNGIISEIKVMVIGFSTDDIYGGGTSVNNKKIKASTINVFRDEFNVEINSAAAQAYMTEADSKALPVVNSFENAEIEDNQLYVYNTEEYVELSFDNYDRKEFLISWDTDADITIYNNYYDEWIMFNNGSRYSGVDAYTDEYGFIRIKAQGFADNYVPLPVIAYFD